MVKRTQVASDELGRQLGETRAALASSASQSLENVRKETLGVLGGRRSWRFVAQQGKMPREKRISNRNWKKNLSI